MKVQTRLFTMFTVGFVLAACSADGEGEPGKTLGTGGVDQGGIGTGGETGATGGAPAATGGATASGGESASGTGGAMTGGETASGGAGQGTGGASAEECTPDAGASAVVEGELVYDARYCLRWEKIDSVSGPLNYADALLYCEALTLGGLDDWRIPTAAEAATVFDCDGMWPHVSPPYETSGDGFWTSTESGTIAGDKPKVCGAGQNSGSYYDFGQEGPQPTRCVQGPNTLEDVSCKSGAICE